jgi:hypothetical protein
VQRELPGGGRGNGIAGPGEDGEVAASLTDPGGALPLGCRR